MERDQTGVIKQVKKTEGFFYCTYSINSELQHHTLGLYVNVALILQ